MKQFLRAGLLLAATAAMATGATISAADAGDLAQSEMIGFSPNGDYVAFQEFGEHDESGITYASIFIIDVAASAPVDGAPIHASVDMFELAEDLTSKQAIGLARAQAMDQAEPLLDQYGIVYGNTGATLVYHPFSDVAADPYLVEFSIGRGFAPEGRNGQTMQFQSLQLTQQEVPVGRCDAQQLGAVSMMSLELRADGLAEPVIVHDDGVYPDERDCTFDYRIQSVVAYYPEDVALTDCCRAQVVLLAIVAMQQFGEHGPFDVHHMGATIILDGEW